MKLLSDNLFSASGVSDSRIELLTPVSGHNVAVDFINLAFGATGVGVAGKATLLAVTAIDADDGQILFQHFATSGSTFHANIGIASTGATSTIPIGLVLEVTDVPGESNITYVVKCHRVDASKY